MVPIIRLVSTIIHMPSGDLCHLVIFFMKLWVPMVLITFAPGSVQGTIRFVTCFVLVELLSPISF